MKYTYACKKVPLNDSIKDYAEKRVEKLEKYFHRDDASAFVTFTVEKDKLCTVEITIRDGSTLLRAQTTEPDGDMRGAIDAAVSYIERQILKNKTRLAKRLRSDAFPAVPMDDFSVAEESEFHIVRTSPTRKNKIQTGCLWRPVSACRKSLFAPLNKFSA